MTTFPPPNAHAWATEAFLEAVRRADHPSKPSRMIAGYAFETVAEARAFIGRYALNVERSEIYEVEGEVLHRGNMELASINLGMHAGAYAFAAARSYWLGEQGPAPALWELLLRPPVVVGRLLDADVR